MIQFRKCNLRNHVIFRNLSYGTALILRLNVSVIYGLTLYIDDIISCHLSNVYQNRVMLAC